jgi:nitronate monooxygenase
MQHPRIIQGGMGVGVSGWRLARAVSSLGQLGVAAGTALDVVLARRLQDGDPGGHVRRALSHFPFPRAAARILERYFLEGGKAADQPYRAMPMHSKTSPREVLELCVAGTFAEVFLAREGHGGHVGINFLEKIQLPVLPSLYGAMLAGVDYVLMGAGIPLKVPLVLDLFVNHESTTYPLNVTDSKGGDDTMLRFDPRELREESAELPPLKRPFFLPIISSYTLALTLVRKANGRVDGFVVEGPTAGGHNAPPRGRLQLSTSGEPVYGERDVVDLAKLRELGLPFWLAGGHGTAEGLNEALAAGAAGIQVGTAFAFCDESGLDARYKELVLTMALAGTANVFTHPVASPTGFPFKVARVEGSLSEEEDYLLRTRVCDLGYLREAYRRDDATIGYRCPSEPAATWAAKGGAASDMDGRRCLCNALLANIGHAQIRSEGREEKPLLTSGDDLTEIGRFLPEGASSYTAKDVVSNLLGA